MRGALDSLNVIHRTFLDYDIDNDDIASASLIDSFITKVNALNMEKKRLYFVNPIKTPLTTFTPDDKPIETVYATQYKEFTWKEYQNVIKYILDKKTL